MNRATSMAGPLTQRFPLVPPSRGGRPSLLDSGPSSRRGAALAPISVARAAQRPRGLSPEEHQRLIEKALCLEPVVFQRVDFHDARHVLEVGAGVGAQTEILLRRFPNATITGVEPLEARFVRARLRLANEIAEGRANLVVGRVEELPFMPRTFDGAFLCWALEYSRSPVDVLREVRRVMSEDGVIYCTELFHDTLFTEPHCPALATLWKQYNEHRLAQPSDPQIGAKLGGLFDRVGLREIAVESLPIMVDRRTPEPTERARFFDMWRRMFASAVTHLLAEGPVDEMLLDSADRELRRLEANPNAVFCIMAMQARGMK